MYIMDAIMIMCKKKCNNVSYIKNVTGGNDPTITKAMRCAANVRNAKKSNCQSSSNGSGNASGSGGGCSGNQ